MAILTILEFPDSRLRKVAEPVTAIDDAIRRLADDLLETMYAAPGVGLAATQVNVHRRVVAIDVSEARNQPLVFINPEIEVLDATLCDYDEGCLSVPGIYDGVERSLAVHARALDRDGQPRTIEAEGLLAVCIQHEMDHLLGKVFVEYLSPLKRNRIKTKLLKQQKQQAVRA